jgi:Mrp family chromosome partitioning ATPase
MAARVAMIAHTASQGFLGFSLRIPPREWSRLPEAQRRLLTLFGPILASGLTFLPAGRQSANMLYPNEILASTAIKSLFGNLRNAFDYIIVDLATLAPVVDTRTTTNFIDSYVYVIEWGQTKFAVVKHCLSNAPRGLRSAAWGEYFQSSTF